MTSSSELPTLRIDHAAPSSHLPLVVDLDGTLIRGDTLVECALSYLGKNPSHILQVLRWTMKGPATLKSELAARVHLDFAHLPYNAAFVDYLRTQRDRGRSITLATAADISIANAVANHLGLFDLVLGTHDGHNLKGTEKLARIRATVGNTFVYAGDSAVDLEVWKDASAAILVDTSDRVRATVSRSIPIEADFPAQRPSIATWMTAIRAHQWTKNALVFVPLLTAFAFVEKSASILAIAAFLSFSLIASSTYIVNDLIDLEKDRRHHRKRRRPLAAGTIRAIPATVVAALLLVAGIVLAQTISTAFTLAIAAYLAVTIWYTFRLKAMLLVDVVVLACLFTLRILGGAIAINVRVSVWLFAFSVFVFTSLALIKRCAELILVREGRVTGGTGRGYRTSDLDVLMPLGIGTGVSAVLVFGLFISSAETVRDYRSPDLLWIVCIGLLYWIARLWVKTARNEMHDDPVQFALTDRSSRYVLLLCVATVLAARFAPIHALVD